MLIKKATNQKANISLTANIVVAIAIGKMELSIWRIQASIPAPAAR